MEILPVDHGGDHRLRPHETVVQPVVAVDDARRPLVRQMLQEVPLQFVGPRVVQLGRFHGRGPGPVPGPQLPSDVAVPLAERAQPHLVRVDGVKLGEHVDEGMRQPCPPLLGHPLLGVNGTVERTPVDQAHDVEPGAGDVRALTERERSRHRHRRRPERRDQGPLPAHVVGLGQQHALWRTPDNRLPAVGVVEPVGQVRVTALEPRPPEGRSQGVDVLGDPGLDGALVVALGARALVV